MSENKKSTGIVAKVLAMLNITEEGRIENFFMKQRKQYEKDIKNLNKNIDTLKDQKAEELDDLKEKLEDANTRVDEAYTSVKIEDIATNELANQFVQVYQDRVERAELEVKRLEERKVSINESYQKRIEDLEKQIAERKRRLAKIQ